jgi:hypothetical protein
MEVKTTKLQKQISKLVAKRKQLLHEIEMIDNEVAEAKRLLTFAEGK